MEILISIYTAVVLSAAVSVIAMTVTKATVFGRFRRWVKSKSEFFGELVSCPFCFSFYVTLPLQLIYKVKLICGPSFFQGYLDLSISYLVMIAIAAFFSGWIYKSLAQIES